MNRSQKIEEHRAIWAGVAHRNGWYEEPFYIQVWFDAEDNVSDSVSFKGLDQDIIYYG